MKKVWYEVVLIKANEEEEVIAKVKSKGLAMSTLVHFKDIYTKDRGFNLKVK